MRQLTHGTQMRPFGNTSLAIRPYLAPSYAWDSWLICGRKGLIALTLTLNLALTLVWEHPASYVVGKA